MTPLVLGAKAGIAVLLLIAGGAKLADLAGFGAAIRLFLPGAARRRAQAAVPAAAGGIAAAELGCGAASLCWPAAGWLAVAVAGLAAGFAVVAAVGFARRRGQPCRCFGALTRRGFGPRELARAVVIMAAAVLATRPVAAAEVRLTAGDHVLLLCGAGLTALAAWTAARALRADGTVLADNPVLADTTALEVAG